MDRGAWQATVHGLIELDTTEVTECVCVCNFFIFFPLTGYYKILSVAPCALDSEKFCFYSFPVWTVYVCPMCFHDPKLLLLVKILKFLIPVLFKKCIYFSKYNFIYPAFF